MSEMQKKDWQTAKAESCIFKEGCNNSGRWCAVGFALKKHWNLNS